MDCRRSWRPCKSQIAHHYFEDDQIVSHLPEFHVYPSMTTIANVVSDEEWERRKQGRSD